MTVKVVTLFGGSGFLGRSIVQRLARAGYRIRVGTRNSDLVNRLMTYGDVGQITPVNVDLLKPDTLEAAVEGGDYVINLMGQLYESGPFSFDLVHYQAPKLIAEYCVSNGIEHLIHVSAIGANIESHSSYARSKARGEQAIQTIFPSATLLRPSIIFGPDDQFFNRFASMATCSPFLVVFDKGDVLMQPVYVGDVAQAVLHALVNPSCHAQIYELGGPKAYSFRELMQLTLSMTKRHRHIISIPIRLGNYLARAMELFPDPFLTRDQLILLQQDNIVSETAKTLKDLDISPSRLEVIVPDYLKRYQPRF